MKDSQLLPLDLQPPQAYNFRRKLGLPALLISLLLLYGFSVDSGLANSKDLNRVLSQCESITTSAGPPSSYNPITRVKTGSDRYVAGTMPTLIRNAKIWTGAKNGTETLFGDILLDKGVIKAFGHIPHGISLQSKSSCGNIKVVDAQGKWVTPGLVDLHSHIGVGSAPSLSGAADTNSRKAPIQPWLRSIDGMNTHDASYELAISGGVTTVQILPGSANNIGGQSFLIKLRPTKERSAISKVIEPPQTLIRNQTADFLHWRHMKHACGENPSAVYSQTRMDSAWNFREAYETARKIRDTQDAFCAKAQSAQRNKWWWPWSTPSVVASEGDFPEDLQWESLVDVLRGRVKLSIHCYEAVDLDAIIRLSNEFKFPIASLHHAGETYLVPELLKKTWGGVPSIALFSSNARKKREAYRNSEFAPMVLANNSIPVVMKSDHPVLNSRYLLYEAQIAHYYGLSAELALASVTSTPAKAAGLDHRVGQIAIGYDADVVLWDSHPLSLGATPVQVYIDGIAQIEEPHALVKPERLQHAPVTPNWDSEARNAVAFEGLPPLRGRTIRWGGWGGNDDEANPRGAVVKFVDVKSVWVKDEDGHVHAMFDETEASSNGHTVVLRDGTLTLCSGDNLSVCDDKDIQEVVDLEGGSLAPGLTTFGSPIGLVEIRLEPSTSDGTVKDPLTGSVPSIVGGNDAIISAVDGLQFGGRNTLLAYRGGVTRAVTAPVSEGFLAGFSTTFNTGAFSAVEKGAIIQRTTALHFAVSLDFGVSVSTQVATLRRLLFDSTSPDWVRVRMDGMPLVIKVDSADVMATLLNLKTEYEAASSNRIQMTFTGASEAHLLAEEIGQAGVSVVLTSPRPFPGTWEQQRILPGPPLSAQSAISVLLAKNVQVAIGVVDEFSARNTRFDVAWAALESNGTISKAQALQLATTHLDRALGVRPVPDLVIYRGGSVFDFESKVVGVISLQRGTVEIF